MNWSGRFAVGIDLGTTNVSVSYADSEGGSPSIFPVVQLIAPGETAPEKLLPSFCYIPGTHELPDGSLKLPWGEEKTVVGKFAREQGAGVPERLISSAKSWLTHSAVNRRNPILPWGSDLGREMLSPLAASALYLEHVRKAWDSKFADVYDKDGSPCLLADQDVIITVPASFDEAARKLTLEAAELAGLKHLSLLEEPMAAFYSWLLRHEDNWAEYVPEKSCVLVVDVGGGTCDFSLVEVETGGVLRRTFVGEHLLLGGDNIDMALARQAETAWKTKLPQRQWSQLCQECRRAKEALMGENPPTSFTVSVAGNGSSLFSGRKSYAFEGEQVRNLVLDGFFPLLPPDAPPPERRRSMQEMGLPYTPEPAVTRHILHFLRQNGKLAAPTHVLFNGGAMLPHILRSRILDSLEMWSGRRPVELPSFNLSLAVSEGAAYCIMTRRGRGVSVKGGIARAYFLEVAGTDNCNLVCVMPRDAEEGAEYRLKTPFMLRTNQPAAFPLYSSATRLGDKPGDFADKSEDFTPLPPLCTAVKHGRKNTKSEVKAFIAARLNEAGVLEMSCDVPETGQIYPLAFDLRGSTSTRLHTETGTAVDLSCIENAMNAIKCAFSEEKRLPGLMKELEFILGLSRDEWDGILLRRLADFLLANLSWRTNSPAAEGRWLNLCGYFLRPGFGIAGDELRIGEAWKLWFSGQCFTKDDFSSAQWYIFWRRIAAGLKSGQQVQAFSGVAGKLIGTKGVSALRNNADLEMWKTAVSLENIPPTKKIKLLETLLLHSGRLNGSQFWLVGRLAARRPFRCTQDAVIPSAKLMPLLEAMKTRAVQAGFPEEAFFALASAMRLTGIRTIDFPIEDRENMLDFLVKNQCPEKWHTMLLETAVAESETEDVLGEKLPLGLSVSCELQER